MAEQYSKGLNKHDTGNVFRFENFKQRVSQVDVHEAQKIKGDGELEALPSDGVGGSFFKDELYRLIELDISKPFTMCSRQLLPMCQSMALVVHNRAQIVQLLLGTITDASAMVCWRSALALCAALAKYVLAVMWLRVRCVRGLRRCPAQRLRWALGCPRVTLTGAVCRDARCCPRRDLQKELAPDFERILVQLVELIDPDQVRAVVCRRVDSGGVANCRRCRCSAPTACGNDAHACCMHPLCAPCSVSCSPISRAMCSARSSSSSSTFRRRSCRAWTPSGSSTARCWATSARTCATSRRRPLRSCCAS
jgi:hypothetical protein